MRDPGGGRLTAGERLGPYEVVAPLGAGGMGEVYRARDMRLRREVAIKVLPQEVAQDPDRLRRFELEARSASALNHPNILTVYDVGNVGNQEGTRFLVTELLDGRTLREMLRDGPVSSRTALELGVQITQGLAAAHEKGIVHRDLKPENLFVTTDGRAKILDFGLARVVPPASPEPDTAAPTVTRGLTRSGAMLGTVGYMSPEQVRGDKVDSRSDIFAFGCVLYEMLGGRRPFAGETSADAISAILKDEPTPLAEVRPSLPSSVSTVVHRCLEKDPHRRFQSTRDLAFALEMLSPESSSGRAYTGRESPVAPRNRRLLAMWTMAAIALVVLGWLLGRTTSREEAPLPNRQPVIVLMDSPLPGRVYDPRTLAEGGTNADDITDALRGLSAALEKENTSPTWHREDQVLRSNPDLIVSHLSALYDARRGQGSEAGRELIFRDAVERLVLFFGYVARANPRTRFLVYSRTNFEDPGSAAQWVNDWETRLPPLRGRLHVFDVPGDTESASFRDPATARALSERIAAIIDSAATR
jgi:serine/threonine protein kinase